jgi:hypothetical protein
MYSRRIRKGAIRQKRFTALKCILQQLDVDFALTLETRRESESMGVFFTPCGTCRRDGCSRILELRAEVLAMSDHRKPFGGGGGPGG